MAGQGKGAVRRSRHIVGGGGTTLFLAGVAVGCVLTWSTQSPESIPNPLRASYQDRTSGEESAFPPSPTYEFYTVLPEGGMDPAAQSEPLVLALDAAQDENAPSEDAKDNPIDDSNGDSTDEDERAGESSQQELKTAVLSEPNSDIQAARHSAEEEPSVVPSATTAPPDSVDRKAEDSPSSPALSDSPEDVELASIQKTEDDPPAPAVPSRYVIQVGSFKEQSEVEKAKASLILMGFRVMVQSMSIDGGAPWHRVRVGPYESLSQTEGARDRLESEGFRAIVLKGQRG